MKHGKTLVVISLVGIAALGLAGCASQPPRGPQRPPGMEKRGFDVRGVINELSLFLPQELTAAMTGGPQGAPAGLARDEKLFLTSEQIGKIVPLLTSLKDNLDPRKASKANEIQKNMEAALTDAQKAEYASFMKAMDDQRGKGGPGKDGPGQQPGGQPPEGQDGGPGGQGPGSGPGAGPGSQDQQALKDLDAFIAILKDYQAQAGGGV
jgi:hypothetical protein